MEKKPSLEHTRLLILERTDWLSQVITNLKFSDHNTKTGGHNERISSLSQELAGHEQGLKAVNSHYALIEALKEAKETIAWMWESFSIDDKNNQSDAFNIPANTISKIEEAIKQCEE